MWAILEQMRDHATTIVGLVTALTLMYSWFRKPMKQLIAREQQQEEDLAILTWAFLQNAHDNYTRQGWCTAAEKEQVLNMHKSYAAKGRNHLSASYEQDILALPETPPEGRRGQMTKQKAYVQFSKRIVLLVTIAVTVISLLAVVLCFFRSDTEALVSTVRTYINYATIVFAAYSGNSVFEKWLTQGKSVDAAGDTEEK